MRRGSVGGCVHENLILALALALSLSLSLAHPRTHAPTHPLTPHLIFLPPPTPLPPCPTSHLPHLQSQLTTPPALIAGRHRIVLDNRQADHSNGADHSSRPRDNNIGLATPVPPTQKPIAGMCHRLVS